MRPSVTTQGIRRAYFGPYGGVFVPETVMAALGELERAYADARRDR